MSIITEFQANAAIARKFEEEGYVVTIDPPSQEIPFDLGNYRPDLLAVKPGDHVIVEVKRPGSHKAVDLYLHVSEVAAAHPGWSFKLVTLPDHFTEMPDRATGNIDEIRRVLEKVHQLIKQPALLSFAMVPLWSACAAALRLWVGRYSEKSGAMTDMGLINLAYSLGLVDFEDSEEMKRLYAIRNKSVSEVGMEISAADILSLHEKISRILGHLDAEDANARSGQ